MSSGSQIGPLDHESARRLLGSYLLGALEADEESEVAAHLRDCQACREEERELRRVHKDLENAVWLSVEPPPELKQRVISGLSGHSEESFPRANALGFNRLAAFAAAAVVCIFALAAVFYASGVLSRAETSALEPTELAPDAGGELRVTGDDRNLQAKLEVWGLPEPEPNGYYELWFRHGEGRVSAGTFTVDPAGRGEIYVSVPSRADYERIGITLEEFPHEPSMSEARVVLGGSLES